MAAAGEPVLVMRAVGGEVLAIERLAEEVVHRLGLADRCGGPERAADRVLGRHVTAAIGLALVGPALADDRVRDPARVRELEPGGPEPFDLGGRDAGALRIREERSWDRTVADFASLLS